MSNQQKMLAVAVKETNSGHQDNLIKMTSCVGQVYQGLKLFRKLV